MLVFKDETIYQKSKYTIILRYITFVNNFHHVEIEYLSPDSYWHLCLPYEDELKKMEESGMDVTFWSKYRKWQKRKKYTQEEFDRIFTNEQ